MLFLSQKKPDERSLKLEELPSKANTLAVMSESSPRIFCHSWRSKKYLILLNEL